MHNCDICGNDKKSTKLYELEFWKDIKDTIFICDECLPIQEETNKKEKIYILFEDDLTENEQ